MVDVSGDKPNWHNRLPTLLHCPDFCSQFTIFKGVTDIILIGKNCVGVILVISLETENILQKVTAGGVVIAERSISKPNMIDYKINCERCPSKLAELLSSMYFIGVMSIMRTEIKNLSQVVVYGWLIFRGTFSVAVRTRNWKCCLTSVLWQKSNILSNMSDHFQLFLKCISQE